ncbi:MAG: hypothetical protein ABI045_01245 [Flavobacteriales bacterium]
MNSQTITAIQTFIENKLSQNRQIKPFTLSWFSGKFLLYFEKAVPPILHTAKATTELLGITVQLNFTTNKLSNQ